MRKKILKKLKNKIITTRLFYKYFFNENIKIKKQNKIDCCFELDIDKTCTVKIENDFYARKNVSIRCRNNGELLIGKNVFFNNNCILTCRKKIEISDNVMIGPNVVIFDHDHNYKSKNFRTNFVCKDVYIGKNVWIGANACILKGSKIGNNCVIAAGAIVNCDIPDNSLYINKDKIKKIGDTNE